VVPLGDLAEQVDDGLVGGAGLGAEAGELAADAPPGTNAREKARRAYLSLEGLDL
jgi:hypothetical protein